VPEYFWTAADAMVASVWDGILSPSAAQQKAAADYAAAVELTK
jgi:hypothetical protein